MNVFGIEEFTAKRRKSQEDLEALLLPFTRVAIERLGEDDGTWDLDLLAIVSSEWANVYIAEGGETSGIRELRKFRRRIEDSLDKSTPESDPVTIATWLATAILNSATLAAAADDPTPLVLEWVTMHDDDVRASHRDAEGQQKPPGEPFKVGGSDLLYPGDSRAPIEEWINCRCALAPARAAEQPDEVAASAAPDEGAEMEDDEKVEIAPATPWHGILAPEGIMSGDGRMFAADALTHRDLPLPLTWQKAQTEGHNGSTVVARIDAIERVDGMMQASGVFLQNAEADEVIGMIAEFGKFGVSVDADSAEFEFDEATESVIFTSARIASASIVSIPAFAEAWIALGPWPGAETEEVAASIEAPPILASLSLGDEISFKRGPGWITNPKETKRIHDYWTRPGEEGYAKIAWGTPGDFNRCRVLVGEKIATNSPEDMRFLNQICAQWHHDALGIWPGEHKAAAETIEGEAGPAISLVAGGGWCAPSDFFKNPELKKPTPLTITDDGRVFGHVAEWTTCHIGFPGFCQTPPESPSAYSNFLLGQLPLDDGTTIPAGNLTIGGGHAPRGLQSRAALSHYDDVSSVFAYVTCGEDEHGIWFSGCLKPGLTDEQITECKMAKISGDWRDFGYVDDAGDPWLDMVAAHAVNTPGFPIPRVGVAARNGKQISLVAAGIVEEHEVQTVPTEANISNLSAELAVAVVQEMAAVNTRKQELAALAARYKED